MLIRICDRCQAPIAPAPPQLLVTLDPTLPAVRQGNVAASVDLIILTPTVQTPAGPAAPAADLCPLCMASALVVLAAQLAAANGLKPAQAKRLAAVVDALVPVAVAS